MGDTIEDMDMKKEQKDKKLEFLEKKQDYQILKILRG